MREETIAAIATPIGEGGIGIIRISGEESFAILSKIFSGAKNEKGMQYGHIKDGDEVIDEVIVLICSAFVHPVNNRIINITNKSNG